MADDFDTGFLYTQADKKRRYEGTPSALKAEPYRSEFRIDYARLMHSPAFRRLQGKTQLFPGNESDFFRNRITHSLEVAQIAKSIAIKINHEVDPFKSSVTRKRNWRIDTDLVEFAGLAHDLGHPPFGHNGEMALDECVRKYGGFEGNAQTLRILACTEKKVFDPKGGRDAIGNGGQDYRLGLNLSFRSLAAILKYDEKIPVDSGRKKLQKGYYHTEADVVAQIKQAVTGSSHFEGTFKTLECSIMDLADDIAYSTYDLEDALKAGFLSLLDLITLDQKPEILDEVTKRVWNRLNPNEKIAQDSQPSELGEKKAKRFHEVRKDVFRSLIGIASDIFAVNGSGTRAAATEELVERINKSSSIAAADEAALYSLVYGAAEAYQKNGYLRTQFTSRLVGEFIRGVQVEVNPNNVALSQVKLDDKLLLKIESLKNYTYCTHIMSPRLQVREHRGKDFVSGIFEALMKPNGVRLLPEDWQRIFNASSEMIWQCRTICDYIAGMTDAYALEFYGRLYSENPQTIFKDH